jgi:hypothetical protein
MIPSDVYQRGFFEEYEYYTREAPDPDMPLNSPTAERYTVSRRVNRAVRPFFFIATEESIKARGRGFMDQRRDDYQDRAATP